MWSLLKIAIHVDERYNEQTLASDHVLLQTEQIVPNADARVLFAVEKSRSLGLGAPMVQMGVTINQRLQKMNQKMN